MKKLVTILSIFVVLLTFSGCGSSHNPSPSAGQGINIDLSGVKPTTEVIKPPQEVVAPPTEVVTPPVEVVTPQPKPCPDCPTPVVCDEPVPCPTCPPPYPGNPVECPDCPAPIVCKDCPEPTVCPDCPPPVICPEPVVCPEPIICTPCDICPEIPEKPTTFLTGRIIWGPDWKDHTPEGPASAIVVKATGDGWEHTTFTDSNGTFRVPLESEKTFKLSASNGDVWCPYEKTFVGVKKGTTVGEYVCADVDNNMVDCNDKNTPNSP